MVSEEHRKALISITRRNSDIEEIFVSFRYPVTEIFRRYAAADDRGKDVLFLALLSRVAMSWIRNREGLNLGAKSREDFAAAQIDARDRDDG
jgi:hypothetical protein